MGTINIRSDITDRFYRYKMEKLVSKIEGKGNGIKSVIVNLSSVAQSLGRSPQYVVKFFGFELGAQVTANPSDDRYIINGAHEASKLQEYLDTFIVKFVLCGECKNPETDLKVTKDGKIIRDCKACGQRTNVDLRHKLSGFILKNPPGKEKGEKKTGKTRGKKNADRDVEENGGSVGNSDEEKNASPAAEYEDGGSDDAITRRIQQEAKELPKAPENGAKDDGWTIDMSKEAIDARAHNLAESLARVVVGTVEDEDAEEGAGSDNPYEKLGAWIEEESKAKKQVDDVEIYKKAVELGIEKKHKTLQVLAQTLFDTNIVKQVPTRAALLKKLITSERHEKAFLGGTERFVGKDHPELIKSIPNILMQYYNEDIISEDVIIAWGSKASKKYVDLATSKKVRKAAEPFLTWLKEAESDDDDEDDE